MQHLEIIVGKNADFLQKGNFAAAGFKGMEGAVPLNRVDKVHRALGGLIACGNVRKKTAEAARKPNSVPAGVTRRATIIHLDDGCPSPQATYPETRAGSPQAFPYLVLHRVGFTKLPRSPGELVRSYRTVSPLP